MPKNKEEKKETKEAPGFYKGYDIRWLRNQPDHSDFGSVAEYDALGKEEEDK